MNIDLDLSDTATLIWTIVTGWLLLSYSTGFVLMRYTSGQDSVRFYDDKGEFKDINAGLQLLTAPLWMILILPLFTLTGVGMLLGKAVHYGGR